MSLVLIIVQLVVWRDSSLKSPVMCLSGMLKPTLRTLLYCRAVTVPLFAFPVRFGLVFAQKPQFWFSFELLKATYLPDY